MTTSSRRSFSLGHIEVKFLSISAMVANAALKAANVELLGFEPTGGEEVLIRLRGDTGAVEAAIEAADRAARALHSSLASSSLIASPVEGLSLATDQPNSINPLYGGREYLLPSDYPRTNTMKTNTAQAIGILETQGLTAILQATDVMLKAADVELVGKEKIGAAYVTIIIKGNVAAVTAAIAAGSNAVGSLGKLIAAQVIARPHADLLALLPK